MRLINHKNIEDWAGSPDSKLNLPIVISKLVRATTLHSTTAEFPSGTAAYVGGWDGIVGCSAKTAYVPEGVSLWEFGTEASVNTKAEDDYNKRTTDPLGYDPKECTFIFVTPRFWRNKAAWQKAKLAENKWKNILVYDSRNLEEWFDLATAVSIWMSDYLNIYPFDGIQVSNIFWEEWSTSSKCQISPKLITKGREFEMNLLLDFLHSSPGIKAVQASTKDEAIAFIIACAMQFDTANQELFFSKTLIVDSEANFRGIRINSTTPLNLIPRFEEAQPLHMAVSKGHHVLIPLGADDSFNSEIIKLPVIDRDGQINTLLEMGLDQTEAEKISKEAGRNITILKKFLGFPQYKAKWLQAVNISEIIPAMLLGRWSEGNKGDKSLIEKLSGENYEEYVLKLVKWKNVENSPIIQIGNTWRLTSPLDLWTSLSSILQNKDFISLKECFMQAFKNGNPIVPSFPNHPNPVMALNKEQVFSRWAREGLLQSLILIGTYGETLKMNTDGSPQHWVDDIIDNLLNDAKGDLWSSLNYEMPLIAEASPESFTGSVLTSLSQPEKQIMEMFIETNGNISPSSNHTGLLWALEGLAWIPEYLPESSLILAKLAALDPGGNLSNRPLNSLCEIFKPWHYQTLANLNQRKEALQNIIENEKNIGWDLFRKLLPNHHGIAHPTHKMRWRMFNTNTNFPIYNKEIIEMHSFIVEQMVSNFDSSENKFAELLDESDSVLLPSKDRSKITNLLLSEYKNVKQETYVAWKEIRKILYNHKSHPNAKWGLPLSELMPYETLYEQLAPSDTILKYIWLFDDLLPELPEGFNKEISDFHFNKRQVEIDTARLKAIQEIVSEFGIQKIINLSKEVKQPWALGETMAKIVDDENNKVSLSLLKDNELNNFFIYSFFYGKVKILGLSWAINLFESLQKQNINNKSLARIFIPLNQGKELWDFIDSTNDEIINQYWALVQPHFYHVEPSEKIQGIDYLIKHKRYFTAIHLASHFTEDLPSDTIVTILEKAATDNETAEDIQFKEYEIGKLFEALDDRKDVERHQLIKLEWFYLLVLDSSSTTRSTKVLHEELANNAEFFVEILKYAYTPKNKNLIPKEIEGILEETIRNRAHQAFKLLYSWKTIPGINADFTINQNALNQWVISARELATAADRLEVADNQIGKILAQYPEKSVDWPPIEIAEIIEKVNTSQIKSGFSTALFNKRGFSGRGPFDGGDIERGHANYFTDLAKKHKVIYPNLSKIFSELSKGYLRDAKKMDDDAERTRLDY